MIRHYEYAYEHYDQLLIWNVSVPPGNDTTNIRHNTGVVVNSGAVFFPGDTLVCVDYDANPQPNITWTWNTETQSGRILIILNNMIDQSYNISCEARNVINGEIHTGYTSVYISVEGNLFFCTH